jgi:hypothetical protein
MCVFNFYDNLLCSLNETVAYENRGTIDTGKGGISNFGKSGRFQYVPSPESKLFKTRFLTHELIRARENAITR